MGAICTSVGPGSKEEGQISFNSSPQVCDAVSYITAPNVRWSFNIGCALGRIEVVIARHTQASEGFVFDRSMLLKKRCRCFAQGVRPCGSPSSDLNLPKEVAVRLIDLSLSLVQLNSQETFSQTS